MDRTEVKGSDIPEIQAIFTEAWIYLKKFYNIRQDDPDEDWEECVNEYQRICKLGKDNGLEVLSIGLAHTVLRFLSERKR